eukprot:scaffold79101_cov65-Phaeocystis_antarctica.AAC.5
MGEISTIVDVDLAIDGVNDMSGLLSRRVKEVSKEMLRSIATELISSPATTCAASFLDLLEDRGSGGWNFKKVVSLMAAMRSITKAEAEKDLGTILYKHGSLNEDYAGFLTMCPVTENITEEHVKVFGSGMNLVLGFHNDPIGKAYKKYFYKLFEAVVKEIQASVNYIHMENRIRDVSTEAFNDRRTKEMIQYNLDKPQAQALGMRHDKAMHQTILNLPGGVSATKAKREAGLMDKKTIAKSYNYRGAMYAWCLRDRIETACTLAPNMAPDAVARYVLKQVAPGYVMRNPGTGHPIGYKKQAALMFSKKFAKRRLQRLGQL